MIVTKTVDRITKDRNRRQDNVFERTTFRLLGVPFFRTVKYLYFVRKTDGMGNRL
jgi:hypothetical protein